MAFSLTYFEPISHDENDDWTDLAKGYNGSIDDYAHVSIDSSPGVFNLMGYCYGTSIKIYFGRYSGELATVKVKVYHDGEWEQVHSGLVTKGVYNTFTISSADPTLLEKVSIETYVQMVTYPMQVHNIQVNSIYISPDAHDDVADGWEAETSIYDRDLETWGSHTVDDPTTRLLELDAPARFVSDSQAIAIKVTEYAVSDLPFKIEIYDGADWTEIFNGIMSPLDTLNVIPYSVQTVTKARITPLMDAFTGSIRVWEFFFLGEYSEGGEGIVPATAYYRKLCTA